MSYTPITANLRQAVIDLHGTHCLRCGIQCTPDRSGTSLHIDHIVPESRGGLTIIDNLQVLCASCNIHKGARTADYRHYYLPGLTPLQRFDQMRFLVPDHVGSATSRSWEYRDVMSEQDWLLLCDCGRADQGWWRGLGKWEGLRHAVPWWRRHVWSHTGIDPGTIPVVDTPGRAVLRQPPSSIFLNSLRGK